MKNPDVAMIDVLFSLTLLQKISIHTKGYEGL